MDVRRESTFEGIIEGITVELLAVKQQNEKNFDHHFQLLFKDFSRGIFQKISHNF